MSTLVPGIDVSRWQDHKVDWPVVAQHVGFAFLRVAYGLTPDPVFSREWGLARMTSLKLSVYQYWRWSVDARIQAEYLCDLVSFAGQIDLAPVLDVEEGRPSVAEIETWLDVVEFRMERKPYIYGPYSFLQDLKLDARFAQYPLFVADYSSLSGHPRVPGPWMDWQIHQHSGAGTLPGVTGQVDMSVAREL